MTKKLRILVTGGRGFISQNLIIKLSHHYKDAIFFNLDISDKYCHLLEEINNIEYYNIDLKNDKDLKNFIKDKKPNKVFHLASNINRRRDLGLSKKLIEDNLIGTINLLDSLVNIPLDSFVFMSTSEVYGDNLPPFNEKMVLSPVSPYSTSKAATELYCSLYYKLLDMPITILRLFNVFGPGQGSNMLIPQLINSCLSGKIIDLTEGEQKREFNYVKDVVNAIILASENKETHGKVINIGSGEVRRIKDIVEHIIDSINPSLKPIFGSKEYRSNEVWEMFSDNTLSMEILDWKPKYSFESAIKETIDWYSNLV